VPGAQEEILTGHIKATDQQIMALPSIPKEERPAILEELRKKKSDRDDKVLKRLKPSKLPKILFFGGMLFFRSTRRS